MIYPTPDGHTIESLPYPQEVNYTCSCGNHVDGIFESMETTSSTSPIGIQQIRITKVVSNGQMNITIRESSEQELQEYIDLVTNNI